MIDTHLPVPSRQELRSWRETWGLTIERAAELAGVSARAWKHYEAGTRATPHWLHTILAVVWGHGPSDPPPAP